MGGQTITLIKTAADIHIDKSVSFWFLNITSPSGFAPPFPLPLTTHHPPPPNRTHSPNLQSLLVYYCPGFRWCPQGDSWLYSCTKPVTAAQVSLQQFHSIFMTQDRELSLILQNIKQAKKYRIHRVMRHFWCKRVFNSKATSLTFER